MQNKIFILGTLCVLTMVSCVKEEEFDYRSSFDAKMKNITINMGSMGTKCIESDTYLGQSMFVTESGDTLYISAYLSDMDELAEDQVTEQTKSTLIGSANFGTAAGYSSFNLNVYKDGGNSIYNSFNTKTGASTPMEKVLISYFGGSSDYKWKFGEDYYWPTDTSSLNFCSYGPVAAFEDDGCATVLGWDKDSTWFSFNYTTPSASADTVDAQNQKDIIVGVNKQKFIKGGNNNVVLSLQHPLMAVRFVLGNIFGQIEYISLKNFNSVGTAFVDTSGVKWKNISTPKTFTQTFDMFDAKKYTQEQKTAGTVELDQTTEKNRNFIIIPQTVPSDAALEIKLGNNLHPISLICDSLYKDGLTNDWTKFAGKVLTFRVSSEKANLVSIDIQDRVVGTKKDSIRIFNDGKSDLYVRAVLVGNWLNIDGDVLAAWDEELPYGTFDGKNPATNPTGFPFVLPSNWYYNSSDGFYYYKKILPSGYNISQNLFDEFILTDKPKVENSDDPKVQLASFEMAILVQAVAAVDPEGGDDVMYSAKRAWGNDVSSFLLTSKDTGSKR